MSGSPRFRRGAAALLAMTLASCSSPSPSGGSSRDSSRAAGSDYDKFLSLEKTLSVPRSTPDLNASVISRIERILASVEESGRILSRVTPPQCSGLNPSVRFAADTLAFRLDTLRALFPLFESPPPDFPLEGLGGWKDFVAESYMIFPEAAIVMSEVTSAPISAAMVNGAGAGVLDHASRARRAFEAAVSHAPKTSPAPGF